MYIIDLKDLIKFANKNYLGKKDYSPYEDPTITYQESILIDLVLSWQLKQNLPLKIDLDLYVGNDDFGYWNCWYLAHYFHEKNSR